MILFNSCQKSTCKNCNEPSEFIIYYFALSTPDATVEYHPEKASCTFCGWTTQGVKTFIRNLEIEALRTLGFRSAYGQRAETALMVIRMMNYEIQNRIGDLESIYLSTRERSLLLSTRAGE